MNSAPIPPALLFRSFLTVVSSFLLAQFLIRVIMLGLGYFVFTDFLEFHLLDAEQQNEIIDARPQAGVPPTAMLISIVILTAISYVGLGYLVVLLAPTAGLLHGFIVSMLVFVWLLQGFLTADEDQKVFDMIYLLVFPISVFVGAHFANRRLEEELDSDG